MASLVWKPKPKPKFLTSKGNSNVSGTKGFSHQVNNVNESSSLTSTDNQSKTNGDGSGFTDTQFKQLMSLFKSGFKEMSNSGGNSSNNWSCSINSFQHLACTTQHLICQSLHCTDLAENIWILDSGATDHIIAFEHLITNSVIMNTYLHLPNGQSAPVLRSGKCCYSHTLCYAMSCVYLCLNTILSQFQS